MRMRPLVSIITPTTHNRALFNERIVQIVAGQDYPHIEHVMSYSDEPNTGKKRNGMIASCSGDVIVNMDSDDWYASDWVSQMVDLLMRSGADVVGLKKAYFYKEPELWSYTYPLNDLYLFGATMCYTRSFWERSPYKTLRVGEDNEFTQKGCKIAVSDYINGFVATVHVDNTSPKNMTGDRWAKERATIEMVAPNFSTQKPM